MKRKIFSVVLTAMLIVSVITVLDLGVVGYAEEIASGKCGDNLTWTLDDAGTLTIKGKGEMTNYVWSTKAPWCDYRKSIKEVIIEDGVTTIGRYAFYDCSALENITIGSGVETIGGRAFCGCYALTEIVIPDSVTTIGDYAFEYCSALENITIGSGVKTIGSYAFYRCSALTEIVIPDNVKTIYMHAFDSCSSLKNVTIGSGVETIGDFAFYKCSALENITIGSGVETIGGSAFESCYALTEIVIPDSVTTIGDDAFWNCSALENITIGSGVDTIGDSAFCYCYALTEIVIPDSVTTIGDYAFFYCYALENITIGSGVETIGSYSFYRCSALETVYFMGTQADWNNITIDSYNDPLLAANIIYLLEKGSIPFEGAQIRTEGEQGLRYIFKIPKVIYENCAEFGSVVMPKKYLGENALEIGFVTNVNGKDYAAKKVPAVKLFGEDDEYIYYTVCITHIKEKNYSSEYVAVPYVITKNANGTDRITYGEEQEMTVTEVLQSLSN